MALAQSLAGAFSDPKELVDRGLIDNVAENEPITMTKWHRSKPALVFRRSSPKVCARSRCG